MRRDLLTLLSRDRSGTSAIEFALVAPLLVAATIGMADISTMAYDAANMQTATRAGVQYAIAGGADETEARKRAEAAWTRKPSGATISAARVCKCAAVSSDCSTPCASKPEVFMTVSATATLGGYVYRTKKTVIETVRIQ
jgi:Flp pilus assembly protein TadG